MEQQYSSIFNEVFGPIMIGTSSSHTAGPYRIGYTAQMLMGDTVKRARISFDPNSSYASYYQLQWSDRGFIAGLFGGRIDSEDTTDAFEIAAEKGMKVEFVKEPKSNRQPNYGYLELESESGDTMTLDTISVGGGAIEIIGIDGFPVSVAGDFNTIFLYMNDEIEPAVGEVLAEAYASKRCDTVEAPDDFHLLEKPSAGGVLYQINTREFLEEQTLAKLEALEGVTKVRYATHVLPVMSSFAYEDMPFSSAKGALSYAEMEDGKTPMSAGELGIRYEMARSGYTREQVMDLMKNVVRVMRLSADRAIHNESEEVLGTLYEVKAPKMCKTFAEGSVNTADLGVLNELNCVAIGISEGIEMERPSLVVASPTIGSVGILPAAVVHFGDLMRKTEEEISTAMFAAGVVGTFVAHQGSFGGEVAGCQAECGSAGAMAGAGVVELLGGSAKQAFTAASICFQNILGQICDAVSIGYEPCNARNALAVSNAMSTANLVMAGYNILIPLDETIGAMVKVGEQLPPCLKGTFGGLCDTPTGRKIAEICG